MDRFMKNIGSTSNANNNNNNMNPSNDGLLGSNGAGQRRLVTPQQDRVQVRSVVANQSATGNFGGFVEEMGNSSSIAASKISTELGNTNEVMISTTNKHGIKLVTRPTTSVANRLGYTATHGLSNANIREEGWDLNAMTSRPALVETISWTKTSVPLKYNVPFDLLVSNFMSVPFLSFKYFRGDIVLQFQVNASPLYQGCMMISYVPMVSKTTVWASSFDSRTWLSMNQSMYVYANTNTVAEMRIPYFHPKGYLSINKVFDPLNNMGTLVVTPLNPLISNTATAPVVNISVYMHLENAEFKVPLPNSQVQAGPISSLRQTRGPLRAQGNTSSSIINNWDHVSGSSVTSKTEGDKLDLKADVEIPAETLAAMDNPSFSVMLPNLTIKGAGHASAATGCEYLEKLSLYPGALSTATFETFGTNIDEMVLSNIKQRYTYVMSFDITPADRPATSKLALPIAPIIGAYKRPNGQAYPLGTVVQDATNPLYMPLISYLALPFTTWTGGMTYKFQFVASAMHTCKIFVGLHYGVYDPNTLVTDLDFTGQYGVAYEINQGSNELEVTAPYIASTPYLYVPRTRYDPRGVMGVITFSIINALAAPDSVAQSISVNVFVAGASDFQVNGIHPQLPFKVLTPVVQALRAQSSVAPTNIAPTVTSIAQDDMAGPDQVHDNIRQEHFSRDVSSIRDVLRKYQFVTKRVINAHKPNPASGPTPVGTNTQNMFLRIDPWFLLGTRPVLNRMEYTSPLLYNPIPDIGAITWFTSMFGLFRGSLRFKIIVRPQPNWSINSAPAVNTNTMNPVPVSWRVFYIPPTVAAAGSNNVALTNMITRNSMDYTVMGGPSTWVRPGATEFPDGTPYTWSNTYNSVTTRYKTLAPISSQNLVSIVASPSIVAEFEIPYMSIYHSVAIKQFDTSIYDLDTSSGLGSVYVCLDFLSDMFSNAPDDATGTPTYGGYNMWAGADIEIYMAFGDDTRLGNLNLLPLLQLNPFVDGAGVYGSTSWGIDTGTLNPAAREVDEDSRSLGGDEENPQEQQQAPVIRERLKRSSSRTIMAPLST